MTDKTKKSITVAACSVISVLLVFCIAKGLHQADTPDELIPSGRETDNVNINFPTNSKNRVDINVKYPTSSQLERESGTQLTEESVNDPTVTTQLVESLPELTKTIKASEIQPTESQQQSEAVTQSTKEPAIMQTYQPQVTKPTYSDEQLTNPNQIPNGSKVDNSLSETKPTNSSSEPRTGDEKAGKIYIPGIGWVEMGGDNQGEILGNEGDELTGEKVGIMD